ncbi:MAG: hypothetical protein QXR87_06855 [Candidatus Hadarchaeales archaeon]
MGKDLVEFIALFGIDDMIRTGRLVSQPPSERPTSTGIPSLEARRVWMHEPHGITVPSLARELRERENIPTSRASVSGISDRTVRLWCRRGKIKAILTPGGHYLIPESEARKFGQKPAGSLSVEEVLGLLSPSSIQERKFYGDLLTFLLQDRPGSFTPRDLSLATGIPLEICTRFCSLLEGIGLCSKGKRSPKTGGGEEDQPYVLDYSGVRW